MDRSDSLTQPDERARTKEIQKLPPELDGISPLNPGTFPRSEDDPDTFAHSPEFHDAPDPGPNVGKPKADVDQVEEVEVEQSKK
jgi:hypothetical protein